VLHTKGCAISLGIRLLVYAYIWIGEGSIFCMPHQVFGPARIEPLAADEAQALYAAPNDLLCTITIRINQRFAHPFFNSPPRLLSLQS
jgi:hypothetical protein